MISIFKNDYKDLDLIGQASDLGAIAKDDNDDARVYGKNISPMSDSGVSFAIFRSEKGRYIVEYPFSEHAIVVEGSVTITNMETGNSHLYNVGEGWIVEKGQNVIFEIGVDGFTKVYWHF